MLAADVPTANRSKEPASTVTLDRDPPNTETDHRRAEGAPGRVERGGALPEARDQRCDVLQLRSKYGGMEISEAKRHRQLEDENSRLKKLLAESMMDVSTLREMLGKNF
jgi:hypothetical protein